MAEVGALLVVGMAWLAVTAKVEKVALLAKEGGSEAAKTGVVVASAAAEAVEAAAEVGLGASQVATSTRLVVLR